MRPIDADALMEKCGDWYVEEGTESGFIGTLKDLLATEPTIQPEKAQLSGEGTTKDTISRQWLLECINEGWIKFDTDKDANRFIHLVRDIAPSVQPEPQEGHWINGKCDLCGEHAPFWCMASTYHESNFCPRCGARMKGVSNERTD